MTFSQYRRRNPCNCVLVCNTNFCFRGAPGVMISCSVPTIAREGLNMHILGAPTQTVLQLLAYIVKPCMILFFRLMHLLRLWCGRTSDSRPRRSATSVCKWRSSKLLSFPPQSELPHRAPVPASLKRRRE